MTFTAKQINSDEFINTQSNKSKLEILVKFACIAPSSHNTQPWHFTILNNEIIVRPNLDRRLKYSDPSDRFLFISLGAALYNLETASSAYGLSFSITQITSSPEETEFRFTYQNLEAKNIDRTTLLNIINRHTNRFPYQNKALEENLLLGLKNFLPHGITLTNFKTENEKKQLVDITNKSIILAYSDKLFRKELSEWIKPSLKKYELGMPGYSILVPFPFSFILPWIIKNFNISKMQQKMHKDWILNTGACAVLSGEDNIPSWINTGKAYEAMAIYAESLGIRTGIIGAPIQIGDSYLDLQKLTKQVTRPQLFFRIGFAKKIKDPSPRLQIQKILS